MQNIDITIENNHTTIFNGDTTHTEEDECAVIDIKTTFNRNNITGCYREQVFETFKVGYGNLNVCDKCGMNFNFIGQSIEMLFVLEGQYLLYRNELPYFNYFEKNEHNIIYYTSTQGQFELKKGPLSLVRINFSVDFLKQFLPKGKTFNDFRKQLKHNKTGRLNQKNGDITWNMHHVINEILSSNRVGFFRKIHMNAMVLRLLLLQLDQSKSGHDPTFITSEKEKILEIKDYISTHYTQPLTLQKLSKKFGTNDFALKKGFKTIVGITVFNYIIDLKMNKAKELLLNDKLPVGVVSEIIGYKNPQHFSTAFKKKFGIAPSKIKAPLIHKFLSKKN